MTKTALALPGDLVSTEWLSENLDHPDLRLFDATYFLPNVKRDAEQEFLTRRIPGARRFDIEAISDHSDPLPHMIPTADDFARAVTALGVSTASKIVAYDALGIMSAARVWWMFRLFGHDQVAVLDGGLPKWLREDRTTVGGQTATDPSSSAFIAVLRPEMVRSVSVMQANLTTTTEQVIDARSAGRFEGRDPEVRPGLRSGHIPGSRNLPYTDLLTAEGTMLPPPEIVARFASIGLRDDAPVVTSCGSGVTACVLALGLKRIGRTDVAVYDGSWTEWGGRADLPLATGPAVD
jgi:thiosulfate/3-mercaptopyruvate sulfurtransferase